MCILLRQQETGKYLQPSGEWSTERETARRFDSGLVAYFWALEAGFVGVDVLLAFTDPAFDIATLRLRGPENC